MNYIPISSSEKSAILYSTDRLRMSPSSYCLCIISLLSPLPTSSIREPHHSQNDWSHENFFYLVSKFFGLSFIFWKVQGYGHIQLYSSQCCKEPSVQLLIEISYFWPQQNTIYCSHLYHHCIHSLHFLFLTYTRVSSVFSFELPKESSLPCIHRKIDLSIIHFACHLASMYYQFKSCSREGKYF